MAGQHWDNPLLLADLKARTPGKETTLQVLQRIQHAADQQMEESEGLSYEQCLACQFQVELDKYR